MLWAAMAATVALALAAGWLFVQDFADFLFGGVAMDPATRDALVNSEPVSGWQQLLMTVAVLGLIAAPVVILWIVARGGQALYRDPAALQTARGKE